MSTGFYGRVVCKLSGFSYPTLVKWVQQGHLKPIKQGNRGRGGNHIFSARHLLALTVVAAMQDSGGHCCPCCAARWIKSCEEMSDSDVRNFVSGQGPCLTGISDETAREMAEQIESQGGFKEPTNESTRLDEDISRRLQVVGPVVLAALDEQAVDFGVGTGVEAKDREQIVKQMTAK